MKKKYIEPMVEMLRMDNLQALMKISDLTADPNQQTQEMDAKENSGWFNNDEQDLSLIDFDE